MNAQNLQSSVECSGQLETLVEDRNHEVGAHCDPDLCLHCVGTRAIVMFDSEVPLDPAEEEFDAPSQLVKHGNGKRRNLQVVGKKYERLLGLEIVELHSSQQHWIIRSGFLNRRLADMIAPQTCDAIDTKRMMSRELKIGLGSRDKECARMGDLRQTGEVHVAAVHHIERSSLEEQVIEPSHIVFARSSDMNARWDWSAQIDLGMHLDAGFGLAKVRPRKKSQRQIDRGGIQSIDRVVEFDSEILAGVKWSCLANETLGQILPNPPVARFVGFGQGGFGDLLGEAKVIKSLGTSVETGGDVAQSIPRCELGKHHADELLTALEMANPLFGSIFGDEPGKSLAIDEFDDLGEDVPTGVHGRKSWETHP